MAGKSVNVELVDGDLADFKAAVKVLIDKPHVLSKRVVGAHLQGEFDIDRSGGFRRKVVFKNAFKQTDVDGEETMDWTVDETHGSLKISEKTRSHSFTFSDQTLTLKIWGGDDTWSQWLQNRVLGQLKKWMEDRISQTCTKGQSSLRLVDFELYQETYDRLKI